MGGVLKDKSQDQWVSNLQLTTWIFIFIIFFKVVFEPAEIKLISHGFTGLTRGFSRRVWLIVCLRVLNGILVPLCLRRGDSMLFFFTKPLRIICTMVVMAALGRPPSMVLVAGSALVLFAVTLYTKAS